MSYQKHGNGYETRIMCTDNQANIENVGQQNVGKHYWQWLAKESGKSFQTA